MRTKKGIQKRVFKASNDALSYYTSKNIHNLTNKASIAKQNFGIKKFINSKKLIKSYTFLLN